MWELERRLPAPPLRLYIVEYSGGVERSTGRPWRQRELPGAIVPLIINFGPPFAIDGIWLDSFVAGMTDRAVMAESTGQSYTAQVNFSPLGAYRLLGVPMHELTNRTIAFEALWGHVATELINRLFHAASWGARFDLLDQFFWERVKRTPEIPKGITWAWRHVDHVQVATIAATLGVSRKHLAALFRQYVGLTPKVCSRVLRFDRAVQAMRAPCPIAWPDLALRCGYYDQAHMIREFRELAGVTPGNIHPIHDGNAALDSSL